MYYDVRPCNVCIEGDCKLTVITHKAKYHLCQECMDKYLDEILDNGELKK